MKKDKANFVTKGYNEGTMLPKKEEKRFLFLCSLKTSENLFSGGRDSEKWHEMG